MYEILKNHKLHLKRCISILSNLYILDKLWVIKDFEEKYFFIIISYFDQNLANDTCRYYFIIIISDIIFYKGMNPSFISKTVNYSFTKNYWLLFRNSES